MSVEDDKGLGRGIKIVAYQVVVAPALMLKPCSVQIHCRRVTHRLQFRHIIEYERRMRCGPGDRCPWLRKEPTAKRTICMLAVVDERSPMPNGPTDCVNGDGGRFGIRLGKPGRLVLGAKDSLRSQVASHPGGEPDWEHPATPLDHAASTMRVGNAPVFACASEPSAVLLP